MILVPELMVDREIATGDRSFVEFVGDMFFPENMNTDARVRSRSVNSHE